MTSVHIPRCRVAQGCLAAAAAAMFLPWQTVAEQGADSQLGTGSSEGQIIFIVSLVMIGLIQVGWRPAWIGAGFVGAITVREILELAGDDAASPAIGLWIATIAAVAAVVLLVWDMFANVSAPDDDGPEGRGLSGPLGRRRR